MSNAVPPAPPQQGPPPGGWGPQGPQQPGWGQQGYQPQLETKRPWFKKKRFIIPLILLAIIIIASATGSGDDTSTSSAGSEPVDSPVEVAADEPQEVPAEVPVEAEVPDAWKNVTIDSCSVEDSFGKFATVAFTIVNPTSKSSMYMLDFKIIDSTGAAVGTANGIENNVLPERPSKGEAVGSVSDSAVAPYTCEIGDVTRMSSS
jgi:hypothetical protein